MQLRKPLLSAAFARAFSGAKRFVQCFAYRLAVMYCSFLGVLNDGRITRFGAFPDRELLGETIKQIAFSFSLVILIKLALLRQHTTTRQVSINTPGVDVNTFRQQSAELMPRPGSGTRLYRVLRNVPIQARKQPYLKVLAPFGYARSV